MATLHHRRSSPSITLILILSGLIIVTMIFVLWQILVIEGYIDLSPTPAWKLGIDTLSSGPNHQKEARLRSERVNRPNPRPSVSSAIFDETPWRERNKLIAKRKGVKQNACGYSTGFQNLTEDELHPKAGERHMITPPEGGKLSLVCCETTKGNLAIVAHHKWAPIGAQRFLDMVKSGYFDSTVPMMRCIKGFLCQFGLNTDPEVSKKFNKSFKDDPNWLPEGPKFRENEDGVRRFAQGYLAYAGAGKNSRGNQLIMSLEANGPLAGGSPWEVPWGELVGTESFRTLSKIYTGYGEDGPGQGKLQNRGMDKELKEEFPKLDYINKCVLVDELDQNR